MNRLRVPNGPAKYPPTRRARHNQWAHYIVVPRIAPDQNGPKQTGPERLLQPQVLTKMRPRVARYYHRTLCRDPTLVRTDHQLQTLYLGGPARH